MFGIRRTVLNLINFSSLVIKTHGMSWHEAEKSLAINMMTKIILYGL